MEAYSFQRFGIVGAACEARTPRTRQGSPVHDMQSSQELGACSGEAIR